MATVQLTIQCDMRWCQVEVQEFSFMKIKVLVRYWIWLSATSWCQSSDVVHSFPSMYDTYRWHLEKIYENYDGNTKNTQFNKEFCEKNIWLVWVQSKIALQLLLCYTVAIFIKMSTLKLFKTKKQNWKCKLRSLTFYFKKLFWNSKSWGIQNEQFFMPWICLCHFFKPKSTNTCLK